MNLMRRSVEFNFTVKGSTKNVRIPVVEDTTESLPKVTVKNNRIVNKFFPNKFIGIFIHCTKQLAGLAVTDFSLVRELT